MTSGRSISSRTLVPSSGYAATHKTHTLVAFETLLRVSNLSKFVFNTPGSEPSLQRPQQSRDQREFPVRRQLPGHDRGEGHERDAVEDSVRNRETDAVGFWLRWIRKPCWRKPKCTKLNRTKLPRTQQETRMRFLFLVCSEIPNEMNCCSGSVRLQKISFSSFD